MMWIRHAWCDDGMSLLFDLVFAEMKLKQRRSRKIRDAADDIARGGRKVWWEGQTGCKTPQLMYHIKGDEKQDTIFPRAAVGQVSLLGWAQPWGPVEVDAVPVAHFGLTRSMIHRDGCLISFARGSGTLIFVRRPTLQVSVLALLADGHNDWSLHDHGCRGLDERRPGCMWPID